MPHFVSQANALKQQELEVNKAMEEIASMDEQQCEELFTDFVQLEGKFLTKNFTKKKKKKKKIHTEKGRKTRRQVKNKKKM